MINPANEQVQKHTFTNRIWALFFYCDNVNTGVSRIMIFTPQIKVCKLKILNWPCYWTG